MSGFSVLRLSGYVFSAIAGASLLYHEGTLSSAWTPISAHAEAKATPDVSSNSNLKSDNTNPYTLPEPSGEIPKNITLYQYEVCPFCCKVKAFLDYHNLPYRIVEVNPLTKSELKWSEYKKVPVVVLDEKEQVNDSSLIISRLASEIRAERSEDTGVTPSTWKPWSKGGVEKKRIDGADEEAHWRKWVDDRLVKVITVNIYRNAKESFQTFDYITEHGNFGWVERQAARIVGATMMWSLSNRLKKKYNVEGDVREQLYSCADEWVDAIGTERTFMGGSTPNLADLAVFGVVRSVVGTDTFMDLLHNTRIAPWYEKMMSVVGDSARVP